MHTLATILMAIAALGTLTSTIFLLLVIVASARFRREQRGKAAKVDAIAMGDWPPVTVLKPLHGAEPRLRETLESFFRQDYPHYEIIFGARSEQDPSLAVVDSLRQQYPMVKVKVAISGDPQWPNAKVWSLEKMIAVAES